MDGEEKCQKDFKIIFVYESFSWFLFFAASAFCCTKLAHSGSKSFFNTVTRCSHCVVNFVKSRWKMVKKSFQILRYKKLDWKKMVAFVDSCL